MLNSCALAQNAPPVAPLSPVSPAEVHDLQMVRERVAANARRDAVPRPDAVDKLRRDLSPAGTWPDLHYADTANGRWSPSEHLSRVQSMALAYATPTLAGNAPNPNFHREALREATVRAYDGWFTALPAGTPPAPAHPGNAFKDTLTTPTSKNWWHNEIGVPLKIAAILLLMPGDFAGERKDRGLTIMARSWVPGDTSGINTGANLSWRARITTARATLTGDAALLRRVVGALEETAPLTDGEGIQPDYSYWQHGPQFYLLGYGRGYAADMTELADLYRGTAFALRPEIVATLTNLALDGYQWAMRGPIADYSAMGRAIALPRKEDTSDLLHITARLLTMNPPRKAELQAFQSRLQTPGAAPLVGNRAFWRSGYMSHQRAGYSVSVRVTSQYLRGGEVINGQGRQSRYTGDGVTYLLRDGSEYSDLPPVMDFRRLPGTTGMLLPQKPGMPSSYVWGVGHFAGGASDGLYGATGYDYARDGVSARKGWFFFDNEYVCLGAGVSAPLDTAPVATSVEQCRLKGLVTRSSAGAAGAPWVKHGETTYFFPGPPASVRVEAGPKTGQWSDINSDSGDKTPVTDNVFSLFIDHGLRPKDSTYAYVVVPQSASGNPAAYAARLPVAVLANTPACQAVRHAGLGLTQAVFYAPGTLQITDALSVTVSRPCVLLLRQTAGGAVTLTVANPDNPPSRDYDQKVQQFVPQPAPPRPAETVLVTLSAPLAGGGARAIPGGKTALAVTLPTGMYAGQSVTKTLQSKPR